MGFRGRIAVAGGGVDDVLLREFGWVLGRVTFASAAAVVVCTLRVTAGGSRVSVEAPEELLSPAACAHKISSSTTSFRSHEHEAGFGKAP